MLTLAWVMPRTVHPQFDGANSTGESGKLFEEPQWVLNGWIWKLRTSIGTYRAESWKKDLRLSLVLEKANKYASSLKRT